MRRSPIALALYAVVLCGAPFFAAPARADSLSTGVDLEHFVPALGEGALLGLDGAGAPTRRFYFAASLDYARGLLAIQDRFTGDLVSRPLRSLVALDLSAEVAITHRFSIALGLPVALGMFGDGFAALGTGMDAPLAANRLGDLRLRLRAHIVTAWSHRFDLAALIVGTAPLDGKEQLFATSGPTLEPRLTATLSATNWLRLAATLGFRFAPTRTLYDVTYGHEYHAGGGADLHLPRPILDRFHLLLEIEGAALTRLDWLELRAGLRVRATPWLAVDAGVGSCPLSQDLPGNPIFRLFTVVRAER